MDGSPCTFPQTIHALRLFLWYFAGTWLLVLSMTLIFYALTDRFRHRKKGDLSSKYEDFQEESDKYFRINPLTRR